MRIFWIFMLLVLSLGFFGCPGTPSQEPAVVEEGPGFTSEGYSAPVEQTPQVEETPIPTEEPPVEEPVAPTETISTDPQQMLQDFILVKMTDSNGGVRNIYTNGRPYILAQTMGQMMEYALEVDDKELFDQSWNFVNNYMIDEQYGLAYSSIWADDYSPRENRSNTDDDMRILWALYEAEEQWGPGYGYKASGKKIADQLVAYDQYLDILGKGVTWDGENYETSRIMDVDDLRWEVMQTLADEDPIWRVMVVKTNQQFLTCQDQGNGLFWQEWDIQKSRPQYAEGLDVSMTSHMLRGARYYSEYKTYVPATTLNTRMKNDWKRDGLISTGYHMEYMGSGNGLEDAETYALVGRNAVALGDCSFAEEMKNKILQYQVTDPESPVYGSISRTGTEDGVLDDIDVLLLLNELPDCQIPVSTVGP